MPPPWVSDSLRDGLVIPAHPLALTEDGLFDEHRQQILTRYYHAAGAGGIAVGVHTTQFEIRDPAVGLYEPVLELAAATIAACDAATNRKTVLVAGICGGTEQATREAEIAATLGYHAGLVSLADLHDATDDALLEHCTTIGERIPLFGFYLQPAVGGRRLSAAFWRQFAEIPNVVAIKVAPFSRYETIAVLRAVADAGREKEIALYTGNDDHLLLDLVTSYRIPTAHGDKEVHFAGGLLGHWAFWTRTAVEHLRLAHKCRKSGMIPSFLLTLAAQITDANAAIFDADNRFAGCLAGIHEVLRRQGLIEHTRCLDPRATLSPGQREKIDRIYREYPNLRDDVFVSEHIREWDR